ncbi:hypothetical protein CASFOL_043115 [Castilleja foliolosa]|uniref:ABC transporter domain-containing protein n=1 Tax=Castilleja foliolosa TaxID=1961234 RepID=A0ABD3B716_9LAMI
MSLKSSPTGTPPPPRRASLPLSIRRVLIRVSNKKTSSRTTCSPTSLQILRVISQAGNSTDSGNSRGFEWFLPLVSLGLLQYMSASSNIIHDCDEVFNCWEPLHFLLYKSVFQIWEYSSQVNVFYAVRIFLGILSVISDAALVVALSRKSPPSSFSMYCMSLSSALFLFEKPAVAVSISAYGVILGWPFSILASVIFVTVMLMNLFKERIRNSFQGFVEIYLKIPSFIRHVEVVGIIGPTGTGKSTILKIMDGLLAPDKGEVLIRGKRRHGLISDDEIPGLGIGLVFQSAALFDSLTVRENALQDHYGKEGIAQSGLEVFAITNQFHYKCVMLLYVIDEIDAALAVQLDDSPFQAAAWKFRHPKLDTTGL